MASQANINLAQQLYVAYYGRPADQAGLDFWSEKFEQSTSLDAAIADFGASAEFTAAFGSLDTTALVTNLYDQIFGRAPDAAGLAFYVDGITDGTFSLASAALDIANGAAAGGTDATTLANKIAVAEAYTAALAANADSVYTAAQIPAAQAILDTVNATAASVTAGSAAAAAEVASNVPAAPGDDIYLTSSTDRGGIFEGTDNNDQFYAYLQQNSAAGGVSNSISSADVLNGGDGADTLTAEIVPEFFGTTGDNQVDIQVRTSSIETVTFEARDSGSNDVNNNVTVTVDAKNMTEVKTIGSYMSDGDLKIENLTTLQNGSIDSVSSMTIVMDHTDNKNSDNDASDLTVLFDEDYLTPTTSFGQSGIQFQIMNQDSYDANNGADRLDGVYVRKMVITLAGVEYDLAPLIQENSETGLGAEFKTETALVAHLNAVVLPALKAANPQAAAEMDSLIFSIGDKWNDANQNRIGDIIVLSVSNEFTLAIGSTDLEISQAEGVPNDFASNRIERADAFTGADSESISINVTLDKVGRDGDGGNLVVGGKDNNGSTDVDTTDGIPTINVTVNGDEDRPSNLGRITSTNNELLNVNVASEIRTDNSYAALTVRGDAGSLDLQAGTNPFGGTLLSFNANSFLGDLAIGQLTAASNINTFTATGGGNVFLREDFNGGEKAAYTITTGAGTDNIIVNLDGDAVDSQNTGLTIATAAGDDTVTVTGFGDVSDFTTLGLGNLNIATGSGADTVNINAEHIYRVSTGTESDFVNVDANNSIVNGTTGLWTIGAGTGIDATDGDWDATVLYEATVTVDFAGFSQTVQIATSAAGNFIATQADINDAVQAAIAANPELAKLLTATAGTGTAQSEQLTIRSTVQGVNDLTISVNQPTVVVAAGAPAGSTTVNASEFAAIEAGLIATGAATSAAIPTNSEAEVVTALNVNSGNLDHEGNAAATDFVLDSNNTTGPNTAVDGTNNTTSTSRAIINLGTGANDLVALDSDDDSQDMVVFTAVWGKVSIVNFFEDQSNNLASPAVDGVTVIDHTIANETIGLHQINFQFWLDDQNTTSGSAASGTRTATTDVVTNASTIDLSDNEVTIVNNFAGTVTDSWAALTAADVDTALTGGATYGAAGITAIGDGAIADTTVLAATNTLVGTSMDSIVMIENDLNDGEYKVFNVETTDVDAAGEAFTVTLLGVIDFGESIDASAVFA